MRHNANAGGVFVYEHVVWRPMGAALKDVARLALP